MPAPTHKLIGCRDFQGKIPVPAGTVRVKSERMTDGSGRVQHFYRYPDTGAWYRIRSISGKQGAWTLCEFVSKDCPCSAP